jgi:hypothetical protein
MMSEHASAPLQDGREWKKPTAEADRPWTPEPRNLVDEEMAVVYCPHRLPPPDRAFMSYSPPGQACPSQS